MNKSLLIVAAMALGTAAVAQDNPAGATTQAQPNGPESSTAPAPSGSDPATAQPGQPSDVTSPSPGAANPGGGNMPAMSGGSSGGNMAGAQQMASSTDTSNYPKCSAGMTDKCVQAGGTHHATHKRMARHHK